MSYVVIARKWRPQQFADVLGQGHVTRTITNAIEADRIAHAFLFSGPRGCGKTSAARILSKALCCEQAGRPTATPCGVCRQCVEITEGRSTDVFEIDAASHTGVDNVREIIENVRYLPSSARFKIYVIDEVHMLSTGAFNALLKTLEEPPAHVKFILATTDVHKVPVTILSRCQRYEFRRIPIGAIAERLSRIMVEEGVEHDPGALALVAREAEGSMRDAQSLLEQVLAFAGGRRLDGALVREALGVVDGALVGRAFEGLLGRDPGGLIELANEVHSRGLDPKRFADALVEESRDLLVAKLVREPASVIDRPSDEIAALVARGQAIEAVVLERLFEQLSRLVEEVAKSSHPRFSLEIGLAAIAEKPERVPVAQLLEKLARVETQLSAIAPSERSPVRRTQNDWRAPGRGPAQYARSIRDADSSPEDDGPPAPASFPTPKDAGPPPAEARATASAAEAQRGPAAEVHRSAPVPAPAMARPAPAMPRPAPAMAGPEAPAPKPPLPAARPSPPQGDSIAGAPASAAPGQEGARTFAEFYDVLRKKRPSLAATLAQVRPLRFTPGEVELGSETSFDEEKLADPETRSYLENVLSEYLGARTRVTVTRTSKGRAAEGAAARPASVPATLIEEAEARQAARRQEKNQEARTHAAVRALEDELGASITRVRVIDEV